VAANLDSTAAKATALAAGLNNSVPGPANLTISAAGANLKVSTTDNFILTSVSIVEYAGTDAKNKPFQLEEENGFSPFGVKFSNIITGLSFDGTAAGGGTVVVSISGPGGMEMPITVATTAGESANSLVNQIAASVNSIVNSMTSFIATPDGSTLLIAGLSNTNTFAAQLTDNGFSSFTMSVSAVPEPSTLVLGAIATFCVLAGAVWRKNRAVERTEE
jgi:PEP-CTERM motif